MGTNTIVSLGFYSPEQYKRLLKTADDRKKLNETWEGWLDDFIRLKAELENEYFVIPLPIDVDEMNEHFRSNNQKNIGKNRAIYINRKGEEYYNRIKAKK